VDGFISGLLIGGALGAAIILLGFVRLDKHEPYGGHVDDQTTFENMVQVLLDRFPQVIDVYFTTLRSRGHFIAYQVEVTLFGGRSRTCAAPTLLEAILAVNHAVLADQGGRL
jgi:hypothetical protein